MNKDIIKSFKLSPSDVDWMVSTAKLHKTTQTDILRNCITAYRMNHGKAKAVEVINTSISKGKTAEILKRGGITSSSKGFDPDIMDIGVSTAAGFAGYYLTSWVREELELDEDKGLQILMGALAGITTLLLSQRNK